MSNVCSVVSSCLVVHPYKRQRRRFLLFVPKYKTRYQTDVKLYYYLYEPRKPMFVTCLNILHTSTRKIMKTHTDIYHQYEFYMWEAATRYIYILNTTLFRYIMDKNEWMCDAWRLLHFLLLLPPEIFGAFNKFRTQSFHFCFDTRVWCWSNYYCCENSHFHMFDEEIL